MEAEKKTNKAYVLGFLWTGLSFFEKKGRFFFQLWYNNAEINAIYFMIVHDTV